MEKSISLCGGIRQATFTVRDDHTLALCFQLQHGKRTLILRDSIRRNGKRYYLFHTKTTVEAVGNTVFLRTAAVEADDNAPIAGLTVTYRFDFTADHSAFYLSIDFGSDLRLSECKLSLLDVSWEGQRFDHFTGYEYDALGRPYQQIFPIPQQDNAQALDYESLKTTRLHVALEKTKARPRTFRKGIALQGEDYLAVIGGAPTYHIEAGYIQTFFDMEEKMTGDVRFLSGENAPGVWFLLEEPTDFFETAKLLETQTPRLTRRIYVPFENERYSVCAGQLQFDLLQTNSGIWITPIFAAEATEAQPCPLFFIDLWDTEQQKILATDSGYGWETVKILTKKNYLRITLSNPDNARIRDISVVAEAFLHPEEHAVHWKMRLVNGSDRWSIQNVSYPQCITQGYRHVYASEYSGMLFENFNRRCGTIRGKYPTGNRLDMAYIALYNPAHGNETNGFYLGIHDADGTPKLMSLVGAPLSESTYLFSEVTPDYPRCAGNSFTLPGEMVWQRFSGDWFDATEIYRKFVFSCGKWLSPLRGREDSPEWLRETPLWIVHHLPDTNPDSNPFPITLRGKNPDNDPDDWYRTAIRLKEALDLPIAYHMYNWHWVPFNNDNPNYFPVHHDLKEGMMHLKQAGVRVVPYVQGYFWDMRDARGEDERFTREALRATAKNINGDPIYYTYAATEPDGEYARLSAMCPTTTVWKNELRQICRRLYKDFGMDGVYLDVLSLNYDTCHDPNHLHPPGWSDYWWKAFVELIAGLRAETPEDFGIISECTAEVYSGAVDGMLSWTWTQVDCVPAFPRVYGGRTAIVGRLYSSDKREDHNYFRFQISQSLVYGQQLGWIHPEIVDAPVQFPFLKKMAQLRYDRRAFFGQAEMLRPPLLGGDIPQLDCLPYLRGRFLHHEHLIQSGAWEDSAGKRTLFVINASDRAAEFTLTVREDEYALPDELSAFTKEDGFTLLGLTRENGLCTLRCRMESEGVGILDWNV